MIRAIKYELKPNSEQRILIKKTCGCCRFIYNTMLAEKINAYSADRTNISSYDLMKRITIIKQQPEFQWLRESPSCALQQSILDMDKAYKNFFRDKKFGFPNFKKKRNGGSFRIPFPCKIDYDKWTVAIIKIGTVKIYKGHNKKITGIIKNYTISYTNTDRYFISIVYETEDKQPLNNGQSVGIDVGIKTFAILSNGEMFENQKYLKQNLKKLRVLQRSASRKYKPDIKPELQSNNWHKTIKQIAKLHEKIYFQRNDYLHKVSRYIADNYSIVCVEDLNIKGMVKNKHLSRAISDCGWGTFIDMLKYKCDTVVEINRFFASSQTCSDCGYINDVVKNLAIRKWTCLSCGKIHDRDINAAINIERAGLALCTLN